MRVTSTPGEILKEEYMTPYNLTNNKLAEMLGVNEGTLSRLVNGKVSLSSDMALRLGKVLGTTPMFWINLQSTHDISVAKANKDLQANIDKLTPFFKRSVTETSEDA